MTRVFQLLPLFWCLTTGCSRPPVPTMPTAMSTTWACAGQSNAVSICGYYLQPYATIVGSWESGREIAAWQEGQPLWETLRTAIQAQPVRAFVWWQGETDALNGMAKETYFLALLDLIRRVRVASGNPALPVVLVELGPNYVDGQIVAAERTLVSQDARVQMIITEDLAFQDGTHMPPVSYQAVAARIAKAIGR